MILNRLRRPVKSVGCDEDGDGLNTIELLTLYSVKEREPLAFAKQPDNVADIISIENTLMQIQYLNPVRPLIVTDNDTRKLLAFRKELLEFKAQVEDVVEEFTTSAQRKIERYLVSFKKGAWRTIAGRFQRQGHRQ